MGAIPPVLVLIASPWVFQRRRCRAAVFISLPFQMSGARSQEPGRRRAPRSLTTAGRFGSRVSSWFPSPGSCILIRGL